MPTQKHRINVALPDEISDRLDEMHEETGVSRASLLVMAFSEWSSEREEAKMAAAAARGRAAAKRRKG